MGLCVWFLRCLFFSYIYIFCSICNNLNIICVNKQINVWVMIGYFGTNSLYLSLSILILIFCSRKIYNVVIDCCNNTTSFCLYQTFLTFLIFPTSPIIPHIPLHSDWLLIPTNPPVFSHNTWWTRTKLRRN